MSTYTEQSVLQCCHRFKVAIADLVPGQETEQWLELEPSDHKKHIRNHSQYHESLNDQKTPSSGSSDEHQQQQHKRRNSDPPVVGTPVHHDVHQDSGRDAFSPMHSGHSQYAAEGIPNQGTTHFVVHTQPVIVSDSRLKCADTSKVMPCCCMTAPNALAVSIFLMALPFDWPFRAL